MQTPPPSIQFGALARTDSAYGDGTFPKYEDRFKLMPRDVWQPVSYNRHVLWIRRQLNGMCTRNGACTVLEGDRSMRGRKHNPMLSAEYHYLFNNRWGTGSTLGGSLSELQNTGTITMEDAGGVQFRSSREFPADHKTMAAKHRMLECIDGNASFDALATGLQRGKLGLAGIHWEGGGGHAFAVTELVQFTREEVPRLERLGWDPPRGLKFGSWGIRIPNSWGEDRGEAPGYSPEELAWLETMGRKPLAGGWDTLTEVECRDFSTFGMWLIGSTTGGGVAPEAAAATCAA